MKPNITFSDSAKQINILVNGIYYARIVCVDKWGRIQSNIRDYPKYQFQEKGYGSFERHNLMPKYSNTIDEAKKYATERITIYEKDNPNSEIEHLNEKGVGFILKFEGQPILRKLLSTEEKNVANYFVMKGLLQKGTSDDTRNSVIYYLDSSVALSLRKIKNL